jgi:hypothetical protein
MVSSSSEHAWEDLNDLPYSDRAINILEEVREEGDQESRGKMRVHKLVCKL